MRISDWSSDVCSSDLKKIIQEINAGSRRVSMMTKYDQISSVEKVIRQDVKQRQAAAAAETARLRAEEKMIQVEIRLRDKEYKAECAAKKKAENALEVETRKKEREIGRASSRARGCKYV